MNQQDSKNKYRTSSSRGKKKGSTSDRNKSSGGRSGRSDGIYSVQHGRKNSKRRKRSDFDITKVAIGVIALLIVVAGVVLGIKGCKKDLPVPETTQEETETELQKEVTVDGISITGLSREAAKELILKNYRWSMKVIYGDQEYQVENLMAEKLDHLLQEIFTGTAKDTYTLDTSGMETQIEEEIKNIAKKWDKPAKNGEISGFDKKSGSFIYSGEESGVVIDQEKLSADMSLAVQNKKFDAVLTAASKKVAPVITEAQAKEMYQVIGVYTTKTTANKDRNTNIRLAAESMDGLIIQPGEEFSFNNTTGARSVEKGYRPAGAYLNGVLVEEPGGGVCQVSSTLYNAVIFSGLTTTERHAHSYEPSYVTPGEDAMVSYGGPDMKFVNKTNTAIAIRTNFKDQKLTISIVGIPILEKGVKLSMKSQKTAELDPPVPVYEEDQTLEPNIEVTAKEATKGSRWVTNLITTKDGAVVSDEFFHNSTYRGKAAIVKRNTSGVVVKPSESSSIDSSAQSGTETAASSGIYGEINPITGTESTAGTGGYSPDGPGSAATHPASQESGPHPGGNTGDTSAAKPNETLGDTPNVISPNPLSQTNMPSMQ